MRTVFFYEKPGCINNRRQKELLRDAGHNVIVIDLLTHPWSRTELMRFLENMPISDWFNRYAPSVKSGEVVPESLNREEAISLLLSEPLLIRRPLMQVGESTMVGFDVDAINSWVGLVRRHDMGDIETCPSS